MKHRRFHAITALLSVLALSAVAAPVQAHEGQGPGQAPGQGHGDHGRGHGHSRGIGMTLTEGATTILDGASVVVTGTGGARVGRDDDDLIVISLGGRHRGQWGDKSDARRGGTRAEADGLDATVTFTSAADTSGWTGFAYDRSDGVITADVDGVEDVPVLTVVRTDDDDADGDDRGDRYRRGGSHSQSSTLLQLTEESADALDAVVGADAFEAGDTFATTSRCGR